MTSKCSKPVKSSETNNHDTETENSSPNEAAGPPEHKSNPDLFDGVHISVLEAFDSLNWNDSMTPERSNSLLRHWIPPDDNSVSHAFKLIKSELAWFLTKEIRLPPWPKNEEKIAFYIPGLSPDHQTTLPKRSVLDQKEQNQLFNFYCRITYNGKLSDQELARFQELRTKVAEEYAEFQEFAKSEWYRGQWKRTLQIPPQIEQFINSLWKMRAGQTLSCYPDEYKSLTQIPLALHDPHEAFSVFEFVKDVHTQCFPPKMRLLKIREPNPLISDIEDLSRIKPVSENVLNQPKPLMRTIPAVSFDSHIDDFLKRVDLDIDVVISMSGIKTLVDNIKFQREWILPITVKHVLKDDGETLKRVVIIDKNLVPKCISVHEKNLWHAKIVAKWMLMFDTGLLEKKEETPSSKDKGNSYEDLLNDVGEKLKMYRSTQEIEIKSQQFEKVQSTISSEENQFDSSGVSQEFGGGDNTPMPGLSRGNSIEARVKVDRILTPYDDLLSDVKSPMKVNIKPKQLAKNTESLQRQEEKSDPLLNNLDSLESINSSNAKSDPTDNKTAKKRKRQSLISYDDPFSNDLHQDLEEFGTDPAPTKSAKVQYVEARTNVSSAASVKGNPTKKRTKMLKPSLQYQLWNLRKSKFVQFLKLEQRSLNVLVRTRNDGKLFYYRNNIRTQDDVCVSSKLEFQPEYGASKMSASELIREYLDLYMRPNSKLIRVRSIGHTKEVMMTELKTISDIKTALQVEVRQMELLKLFDPLYAVLTKLIDLAPGRYMLQHTAKMGPFATLMVETPGWSSFNLPQYCQEMTQVEVNVPPMPIDPLVLTPLQHRDRVAPALFIPGFKADGDAGYFRKPKKDYKGIKARKKKRKKGRKESLRSKSSKSDVSSDANDSIYTDGP